ncbi:MAG: response regulator transcription factor [Magnetococcales bacterium]|nr:response regulator transcription factor [Magnetococcales bacterium]
MIRIILADDHNIFLQGLTRLIQTVEDIEIIGMANNGEEALKMIETLQPDVAVLDISMDTMNGIDVARYFQKSSNPKTRILLLTMHEDPMLAVEALHAGASGFLLKENTFEELSDAIHTVHAGGTHVTATIKKRIDELERFGNSLVLSQRERQVLTAVASGQTNKEIARQLELSPKTVETYRTRIMDKLNVRSIAQLSRFAVKLGLVE